MRITFRAAALVGLVLLASCSDSSGPGVDLSGHWTGTITGTFTSIDMNINQGGHNFSGTATLSNANIAATQVTGNVNSRGEVSMVWLTPGFLNATASGHLEGPKKITGRFTNAAFGSAAFELNKQ